MKEGVSRAKALRHPSCFLTDTIAANILGDTRQFYESKLKKSTVKKNNFQILKKNCGFLNIYV
jgi:hypothetical protein